MSEGQDKILIDRTLLKHLSNYLHCWKVEWASRHQSYYHPAHLADEACIKELLNSKAGTGVSQTQEPDWTNSLTAESSLWKNPLLSLQDRLNIADGAIAFQAKIIDNLKNKLKEKEKGHD